MPRRRFAPLLLLGLVLASLLAALPATAAPGSSGLLRGHEQTIQKNNHALGLTLGGAGMNGFAYRRYLGNMALQLNALPVVLDRGDYLAIHFGGMVINYTLVWSAGRTSLAPTTTALRLVGGTSVRIAREEVTDIEVPDESCNTPQCKALTANRGEVTYNASIGAGFGFEFGAVMRPGFSVAVDLMMTLFWDREGFEGLYPFPHGALMYSW